MLTQTVAGRVYDYSRTVGGRYIPYPVGIAVGEGDDAYVLSRPADTVSGVPWNKTAVGAKVTRITIGGESGDEEFVCEFSGYGDRDGELIWPAGIALDSQENVYVTDEWLNRVSAFDKEGNFLGLWGVAGNGDGEFNRPSGIAIDRQDVLYISDSLNNRIQKFTKDGAFLGKWGALGNGEGELSSPWGIDVDDQGNVYVADHKNNRAQKFTSDGEFVAEYGSHGSSRGQLNRPSDVAVDPEGDVYVCDWANDRVQAFQADGKFITSFIGDAQQLAKWHQLTVDANVDVIKARRRVYSLEPEWRFAMPTAVVFDAKKQRLLVADTQRGRLQIYDKVKDYLEPQFNL
jgi:DNA-binding beta-propeller fold protein YncE